MVWKLHYTTAEMTYRPLFALLFLFSAATARAESTPDAQPQPMTFPQARVETVFEGATQALLFDQKRGEYVVVRAGDSFQGLAVTALTKDHVILSAGAQHYILPLPAPAPVVHPEPGRRTAPVVHPEPGLRTAPAPVVHPEPSRRTGEPQTNPTSTVTPVPTLPDHPLDPYAIAPVTRAAPPTGIAETPVGTAPVGTAPVGPTGSSETPVGISESPVRDERVTVSRADLDAALSDFTALSQEIQVTREGQRIRIQQLATGSFPYRLGLRTGDLLVSVADKSIYDLDAAAQAYSVLIRADEFEIKLYRGDKRMKIHVRLKR
ncbi:MAG TPA: hypothetical protein VML75_09875 [Kofleriaceae bacterium]|nr:hypothetical protein [Kofleriaceae bacterium]